MDEYFKTLSQRLSNIESILLDLLATKEQKESPQPSSAPITIKKVADITNLAEQTLYGLVSARKIPHFKQGKKLYFFEEEIIKWIRSGKRKTADEISVESKNYNKERRLK